LQLHLTYPIDGRPVLGTYGRTDLEGLVLAQAAGMNLVFGGEELLDVSTERGRFCREHGIKVMHPLTHHVYGRPSLSDDVDERQAELPIHAGTPLPGPGLVQVEQELVRYREAAPDRLLGCTRGAEGTDPAAHRAGITLFWPEPLAREVAELRDSPNLYGYYVLDDSPGNVLWALRGMYRIIKHLDPGRPVCGGYSGTTTLHNFAPDAVDMLMLYHYPVLKTGYERAMTSRDTQWMLTAARRQAPGVPFLGIYQAFWGGEWNKQQPLTPSELREQMEDFVREGASGLIAFYTSPPDVRYLGWNVDEGMARTITEVNQEIRSTGGLALPPEPEALARLRFQPAGHWQHPQPVPGLIPAWWVLAPFADQEGKGLEAVFPPERQLDLAASYQGKGRTIRWLEQRAVAGAVGLVELYGNVGYLAACVAYATCTVTSPRAQPVQLRFSSDDDALVWLNGRQVWRHDGPRGVHWDSDLIPLDLPAGESRLLVKVYNRVEQWGLFARFTDPQGRPLEGLSFSPAPDP